MSEESAQQPPSASNATADSQASLEDAQTSLLLDKLLTPNKDTVYGLAQNFSAIDGVERFRQNVPLVSYENIRHHIDQMADGQANVLTAERVVAFFKTSGSQALPKLIPVTTSLMRQKTAAFSTYWADIYAVYPSVSTGAMVTNFSDASDTSRTTANIEVFSESGFWGRRGRALNSMKRWPLPAEIRLISSARARWYAIARVLLQTPLNCIMCLNPSTLLQFCRTLTEHSDALIQGLSDGNWGTQDRDILKSLSAPDVASLSTHLRVDPESAQRTSLFAQGPDKATLLTLWPELDLIICWRSGLVQPYFVQLSPYTRGLPVRDYISQSSECMMAIPFEDDSSGGALAWQSHFFEFIAETDIDQNQPPTRFAWQLDEGEIYELVVTTGGGLYRYRMGDCFRVRRHRDGVPVIEFLYRSGKTSSMTGEKLTEFQVLTAADNASRDCRYSPTEILCYPCSGATPHYGLLLEQSVNGENSEQSSLLQQWAASFDSHLKTINSEYADKCSSGRLGDIMLFTASEGALLQRRLARKKPGVSDEQVKAEMLSATLDLHLALMCDPAEQSDKADPQSRSGEQTR